MNRDALPWAAPAVLCRDDGTVTRFPKGTTVPTHDAAALFGEHFDPVATYIVADDFMTRRVVDEDTATANGLRWTFTGVPCANGHIAPRKLRSEPRGSECMACRRAAKRRKKLTTA